MRADFFDFRPEFKLMIAGNLKPQIRVVDDAMRARVVLVPWEVSIPKANQVVDFVERFLQPEWPSILRWMLDGLEAYLHEGLAVPASVSAASEECVTGEDWRLLWLSEECRTDDRNLPRPAANCGPRGVNGRTMRSNPSARNGACPTGSSPRFQKSRGPPYRTSLSRHRSH